VTNGKLLSGPSCPDVKTYPVRIQGEDVEVGF
jgi:nitrite reductase/ring-hydroxylating ferredoxin subunit